MKDMFKNKNFIIYKLTRVELFILLKSKLGKDLFYELKQECFDDANLIDLVKLYDKIK